VATPPISASPVMPTHQPASAGPPASSGPPPTAPAKGGRAVRRAFLALCGLTALAAMVYFGATWWAYRSSHSITDDAFIEAHIVNIAPQSVSGHLVRLLVDEDERVEAGQLLAEIDPVPYQDQVNIARSKVDTAQAELRRQESALARLRVEVPIQIEIARRTVAAAQADQAKAREALKLTEDEVEKAIEEAQANLDASKADLVLAEQEYTRYTNLQKEEAVPLRRAQEVTRSRDAADAHRKLAAAKLALAVANRTQIDVAKRGLEAAEKNTQKAAKGVDLSETGNDQIREVELLTVVKKENVEDARRALKAAETSLSFTQIRAPIPGVVVKRYRHLGDFASPGIAILSMYDPELTYVTANLEETRLRGVAPGNSVELQVDAFAEPFRGRVVWIDKSTGAQFALMPRNVVSGEFTRVVQRVPVRIAIEKDERWPLLRAGLSVTVSIAHGNGDPQWAERAAREMRGLEMRYNVSQSAGGGPETKDRP
jgi:membrane fusion protein (multidrug efflux system)